MAALCLFACARQEKSTPAEKLPQEQRIKEALQEDFQRTYDPALGYPPKERLYEAYLETRAMQKQLARQGRAEDDLLPKFDERGPIDIGGRTRTILVDSRDPEGKKVWAGSVAGGLFLERVGVASLSWLGVVGTMLSIGIFALSWMMENRRASGCMCRLLFCPSHH